MDTESAQARLDEVRWRRVQVADGAAHARYRWWYVPLCAVVLWATAAVRDLALPEVYVDLGVVVAVFAFVALARAESRMLGVRLHRSMYTVKSLGILAGCGAALCAVYIAVIMPLNSTGFSLRHTVAGGAMALVFLAVGIPSNRWVYAAATGRDR